jgi:hypothetical protein
MVIARRNKSPFAIFCEEDAMAVSHTHIYTKLIEHRQFWVGGVNIPDLGGVEDLMRSEPSAVTKSFRVGLEMHVDMNFEIISRVEDEFGGSS